MLMIRGASDLELASRVWRYGTRKAGMRVAPAVCWGLSCANNHTDGWILFS